MGLICPTASVGSTVARHFKLLRAFSRKAPL